VLVGDSLGNVIQGETSTLPVTLAQMAYHVRCVARGTRAAFLIADMPFGSYEASPELAFASAAELMRAGAQMVKLEGGGYTAATVSFLVERGIAGVRAPGVDAAAGARARRLSRAGPRRRGGPAPAAPMPARWPTPGPRCWCSSWCLRYSRSASAWRCRK
jgi:hypothetical protein